MGRLVIRRECRDGRRAVRLVLPDRRVITVTLEDTGRGYARLAFECPGDVLILREELEAPPPASGQGREGGA